MRIVARKAGAMWKRSVAPVAVKKSVMESGLEAVSTQKEKEKKSVASRAVSHQISRVVVGI
jgi:predicted type IV restriction endonuclease